MSLIHLLRTLVWDRALRRNKGRNHRKMFLVPQRSVSMMKIRFLPTRRKMLRAGSRKRSLHSEFATSKEMAFYETRKRDARSFGRPPRTDQFGRRTWCASG